ncbi:MAG: glyoxylate/hydroxypyruvate reductase A [Rhodospirillales bacterium]|nr:glyoxylate/hydroxypyruvate reductase A [Rhodospirillales bacterium]
MTIAIAIMMEDWETPQWVREQIAPMLPGVDIRCVPEIGSPEDIEYLVCDKVPPGLVAKLPNLKMIQKLGAGVESMVREPGLGPDVRIARVKSVSAAREIAEYSLLYVLREHRHARQYAENQTAGRWKAYAPKLTTDVTVGVLGLGHIGGRIAKTFADIDFKTIGWSRTEKNIPGVKSYTGEQGLKDVLSQSDYVISILPSTEKTRGLMNIETFKNFKPESMLINVGRGDLIVDEDLITALTEERLAHAVLDVFNPEPPTNDHPFWSHPNITITPHVSGWNVLDSIDVVAENYKRMKSGDALLHEIDREAGY